MSEYRFKTIRHKSFNGVKDGPRLLVLAGVHGDEYEPMAAAMELMNIGPEVLKNGTLTIVPVVNYAAFKRAARTAEDGLDLARTCPGRKDGTATELMAAEVSELISDSDYLIDLHTGGGMYELAPLCGYVLHERSEVLDKQRQMAHAFNLETIWGTSSKLNGRTLSVARDHNVPAIYTEYGGGGRFRKFVVKEYVQGCLNVINSLGMSDGLVADGKCLYEVEDHREESGHLQVMLPAAAEGLFEPRVRLGEFVRNEQVIGMISNPFDQKVTPVYADQDGMVFLLRAVPSVSAGDTLGGILPILKPGKVVIT